MDEYNRNETAPDDSRPVESSTLNNEPAILNNEASEEKNDGVIEEVISKHENQKICREHMGDVLMAQITACIIILLIVVVANIIRAGTAESLAAHFCEMTKGETEEFIRNAVKEAIKFINAEI